MMFCIVGEMDCEKLWKSLWKGGLKWMKWQRWDLRGRKWEQVNVPQIPFLSKQDVLWCFIYKATKAQKAERARLAAKPTVRGTGSNDRERRWEVERRGEGTDDTLYPSAGEAETWKADKENGEQTKLQNTREETETLFVCGPEKNEKREGEKGVLCGTAVVTMANAAWCDVSLAAEPSWTPTG